MFFNSLIGLSHRSPNRNVTFSKKIISGQIAVIDSLVIGGTGLGISSQYLGWNHEHFTAYLSVIILNTILTISLFYIAKLYRFEHVSNPVNQIKKVVSISTLLFVGIIALLFALKISLHFSRVWLFSWYLSATFFLCVERTWFSFFLRKSAEEGKLTRNTLIFGAGKQGQKLIRKFQSEKYPWIRIVGFFDDRSDTTRTPSEIGNYPVLGDLDALIDYTRKHRCDEILVTLPWIAEKRIHDIVQQLKILPLRVQLAPDLVGMDFGSSRYEDFSGIPVLNVLDKPLTEWDTVLKGLEDRILAALFLVLLSPLFVLVAFLIKIDSPGPVFFRQKRYGFNNMLIEVVKFRSLRADHQDNDARTLVSRDDPRVTRVGAIIRRTSLDELPQLLNVLKGEMSIVGPRPHALEASAAGKLYEDAVAGYAARHKVKPGITGWAQVNGFRGETDTEDKIIKRVEHDIYYIDNWSLLFDMIIILRTLFVFFQQDNAY